MASEPSKARTWLLQGGGGFEDGEDGIRAVRLSGESLIEFLDAYGEHFGAELATARQREDALEKKNWLLGTWLAEADFGFGGWFSTMRELQRYAREGKLDDISSVVDYCVQSEKDLEMSAAKTWKERAEKAESSLAAMQGALELLIRTLGETSGAVHLAVLNAEAVLAKSPADALKVTP